TLFARRILRLARSLCSVFFDLLVSSKQPLVLRRSRQRTFSGVFTALPLIISCRNKGQQSNRSANSGSQQSRGSSESYSYPVCTTRGRRHPGECCRAAGTCFKCGQAGHLQKDYKKNTTTSTSGQVDKKPGASGHVFAITEGHAANTSG
nr:hypothetical protein [Tanacetum cinerariifolium]